jgi:hypothetical protein
MFGLLSIDEVERRPIRRAGDAAFEWRVIGLRSSLSPHHGARAARIAS